MAALAGGAALTFEPDTDEEEVLLPGVRVPSHSREAESEEMSRSREETPRAH